MDIRWNRLAESVLSKNKKNIESFVLKIFIFYNFKNHCILHGQVFVKVSFMCVLTLCSELQVNEWPHLGNSCLLGLLSCVLLFVSVPIRHFGCITH